MYNIIGKRKIWFIISGTVIVLSIAALAVWGLKLSIDFTGGSLVELKFNAERPSNQTVEQALAGLNLPSLNVQPVDTAGLLIRTVSLTEDQHQALLLEIEKIKNPQATGGIKVKPEALGISGPGTENLQITATGQGAENLPVNFKATGSKYSSFEEIKFDSIGPILGQELKQKTIYAIIIVLIAIIAYIGFAFRKVSYPVESWKYGLAAIIALIHDVTIVPGVFAALGHFLNIQVDAYFVTALLTLLGFSVHDTIVTFDRIRENLPRNQHKTFEEIINQSVNETLTRSLNTSFTAILVLAAVFLFGGVTTKYFVLALMLGVFVGTYSSIFIASPLLLIFYRFKLKTKQL
ncbi:MAG: protein translocase subunit SecF [Candidatus Komeilibacteria bacterium]|nr:protein translocase subunit SecF [Candidatus Komeilibacteria bacterium]